MIYREGEKRVILLVQREKKKKSYTSIERERGKKSYRCRRPLNIVPCNTSNLAKIYYFGIKEEDILLARTVR